MLVFVAVLGLLFMPHGFVSKTIYRQLGSWMQQHLCVSSIGGYSLTGLILASAIGVPLVALILAAGFWIRHGLRMVREKTNDLPGRKPLFDKQLIEGSAAVRGGWIEVGAAVFLILACAFILLWPLVGADTNVFLRPPSEMEACKATT